MKAKFYNTTMLLIVLGISTFIYHNPKNDLQGKVLSSDEMSLIEGRGCSIFAWIAALAADVGCAVAPDPWLCLSAAGTSADCIYQLLGSSSGSPNPNSPPPSSGGVGGGPAKPSCPCPR